MTILLYVDIFVSSESLLLGVPTINNYLISQFNFIIAKFKVEIKANKYFPSNMETNNGMNSGGSCHGATAPPARSFYFP